MRIPRSLSPRLQHRLLMKFGHYEKVFPVERGPDRAVPDHIEKPPYYYTGVPGDEIVKPEVKSAIQIEKMKKSCKLASDILLKLKSFVRVGVTTDEIDHFVHELCIAENSYPSPLHYKGYPKSICTSVNNVIAHGIPDLRPLQDGDIVNVDLTIYHNGYHGDCSTNFLVGNVDDRGIELVQRTKECLDIGIKCCGPNVPFTEIGNAISKYARRCGLTVLPGVTGHGIGSYFHGPPDIYHVRNFYPGKMQPGMTFTIEPSLSHGKEYVCILEDGWTVVTEDDARSAQMEHTILITDDGADILTSSGPQL